MLYTAGIGCGFFPGAVIVHCWRGSESAIRDFAPSAGRWRSRVAKVSRLVRETEKWWKCCFSVSFPVGWCCPAVETGAHHFGCARNCTGCRFCPRDLCDFYPFTRFDSLFGKCCRCDEVTSCTEPVICCFVFLWHSRIAGAVGA